MLQLRDMENCKFENIKEIVDDVKEVCIREKSEKIFFIKLYNMRSINSNV